MNATEGMQEVAHCRPHPFGSVDVHFTDAIAIIIPRPLFLAVTNRGVQANDVIVALPFVGEYHSISLGEHMNVMDQGLFVSWVNYSQTHLPALASKCTSDGRSIFIIGAMSPPLVGPPPGWIIRIVVTFTFSPRVLKHLVRFSPLVWQRLLELQPFCIGLDRFPHIVSRLTGHSDLACNGRRRLALAHPTQQQNCLRWPKVLSLEHCPTV